MLTPIFSSFHRNVSCGTLSKAFFNLNSGQPSLSWITLITLEHNKFVVQNAVWNKFPTQACPSSFDMKSKTIYFINMCGSLQGWILGWWGPGH